MAEPLPLSRKLRWMLSPPLPVALRWLLRDPRGLLPRNLHRASGLLLRASAASLLGRLGPSLPAGRKIPPVFIVGFWRSGTTWLHELLTLDPEVAFPTCYDCLAPGHAHWTADRAIPFLRNRFASRRPMDEMEIRVDFPMEDEFFLLNQGVRSFYELFLFPDEGVGHLEALDPEGFPESDRQAWLAAMHRLLALLSRGGAKRAILKSPTHAFRIPFLLRHFPEARFIHIHRDPVPVFLSTRHTWLANARMYAMDPKRSQQDLDGLLLACYQRYRGCLDEARAEAGAERWLDLDYGQLCADPASALERVYQAFGWEGFETQASRIATYQEARSNFRPNRFETASDETNVLRVALSDSRRIPR